MFNGMMMDPELMRMAQEQMSRMSPADFARMQQQMMSNPELMRMASEGMQNLGPEDFRLAAEQLKHTRPEEIAEMSEKMAKASPEELASMRAQMDAQVSYTINGAEMLKKQGNELHSQGKYQNALEKYVHAKNNLKDVPYSKGKNLLLACSLNMMSCYLKTKQYDKCIGEGTEVLAYDSKNVKALYRRGQAYKALGQLGDAVSDLRIAHEVSLGDETIADVLRDAKERLNREGAGRSSGGVVIEDITESQISTSDNLTSPPEESGHCSTSQTNLGEPQSADYLESLRENPESIRSFQNFLSRADPETLSAISGGKVEGMSPDTLKTASDVISKLSPEELNRMFKLASTFQGENPFSKSSSGLNPGSVPSDLSPDILKTASDMMGKMSPEELQKMFEMSSSLKGNGASSSDAEFHANTRSVTPDLNPEMIRMASEMMGKMSPEERQKMFNIASSWRGNEAAPLNASSYSNGPRSNDFKFSENMKANDRIAGESSFTQNLSLSSHTSTPQSSALNSSNDLHEQMRNQMKDPAMRQMLSSMMKNMSPEMMSNMSEQFGFKLSREEAEKAQQAMASLSPESLDKMMRWADRVQRGVEGARKMKNWLLGRPGMIMAILMLFLAIALHWFGVIGQ